MLNSISQKINDIEYGFNFSSLIILVPAISLIVQNIKIEAILKEFNDTGKFSSLRITERKIDRIYKWHACGAAIQIIAFTILLGVSPLFLIPCVIACIQFQNAALGYFSEQSRHKYLIDSKKITLQR